jgi:hypothetical protein
MYLSQAARSVALDVAFSTINPDLMATALALHFASVSSVME